jgi:DNA-binding IscR family transcriptional regulator
MSDSQKFPVAAHALAYMAHKGAFSADSAVSSTALAASMPTNPVVVRRVTAMLAKAGLIDTRAGAGGGAWLLKRPEDIRLDEVLRAVDGCAHLGRHPDRPVHGAVARDAEGRLLLRPDHGGLVFGAGLHGPASP